MISNMSKMAIAIALGWGAFASTAVPVNAMPVQSAPAFATDNNVIDVQAMPGGPGFHPGFHPGFRPGMQGNRMWSQNRDGRRCATPFGNCRHFYRGYYYENPWWTLPLIVGGAVASQRDYADNYGDSHTQACVDRYRSYDPGSDSYLGFDGDRHRCTL